MKRKIELLTNIITVVVCVCFILFLAQKFFLNNNPPTSVSYPSVPKQLIGTRPNIIDINLSQNTSTIIIVMQKDCIYCTQSALFYIRLNEKIKSSNTKLIAILPNSKVESIEYLNKIGLPNIEIGKFSFDSIAIQGTPTILLLDKNGEIIKVWVGKLTTTQEEEVLNTVS